MVSEAIRGRVNSAELGLADELQAIRKDVSDLGAAVNQQVRLLWQDLQAHREELDSLADMRKLVQQHLVQQGPPRRRHKEHPPGDGKARGAEARSPSPAAPSEEPSGSPSPAAPSEELLEQMVQRSVGTRLEGLRAEVDELRSSLRREVRQIADECKDDAFAMSQLTHRRLEDLGAVALEAHAAAQAAAAGAPAGRALQEQVRPLTQATACPGSLGNTTSTGSWVNTMSQTQEGAPRRGSPGAAGGAEGPGPRMRSAPVAVGGLDAALRSAGASAHLPGRQAPPGDARLHSAPGTARSVSARRELPFPARGTPSRGWHW